MLDSVVNWAAFTPVFAIPLMLAAFGLIINERAGVLNLGAEGIMLCGALAGVVAYLVAGNSVWMGSLAAVLAGMAMAALFAFLVVVLRANQVVTGITMVFFGAGLTGLLGTGWTDKAVAGFRRLDFGFLSDIPILGQILFSHDAMVYLTIPIGLLVWYVLYGTIVGMNLRAVGENPQAADSAGINVTLYRFLAVVAGGGLIGLAGGYLALASAKIWVEEMTHGRGWIAIALVIFARWMPGRAVLGALLFGGVEAAIPRILAAGFHVPQYFLLMTPYVATLVVLTYVALTARTAAAAPAALGQPYVREDRR